MKGWHNTCGGARVGQCFALRDGTRHVVGHMLMHVTHGVPSMKEDWDEPTLRLFMWGLEGASQAEFYYIL